MFKTHFSRSRPYVSDPSITPCVAAEKGADLQSYPSAHSTMAYAMGVVLAHLLPSQAPAILERARLYTENRIRCGAHHRSDTVAGQVLGTVVAVQLLQNPVFAKQVQAARAELNAAGLF